MFAYNYLLIIIIFIIKQFISIWLYIINWYLYILKDKYKVNIFYVFMLAEGEIEFAFGLNIISCSIPKFND